MGGIAFRARAAFCAVFWGTRKRFRRCAEVSQCCYVLCCTSTRFRGQLFIGWQTFFSARALEPCVSCTCPSIRTSPLFLTLLVLLAPCPTSHQLAFRQHHRWRLKPHFQPGDPCYSDRDESHTVTALPEELRGKHLMQIVTMQVPRDGRRRWGRVVWVPRLRRHARGAAFCEIVVGAWRADLASRTTSIESGAASIVNSLSITCRVMSEYETIPHLCPLTDRRSRRHVAYPSPTPLIAETGRRLEIFLVFDFVLRTHCIVENMHYYCIFFHVCCLGAILVCAAAAAAAAARTSPVGSIAAEMLMLQTLTVSRFSSVCLDVPARPVLT